MLRSGRTPGRTPTRMARAKTPLSAATTVSTGLTPRRDFDLPSFSETCEGLLSDFGASPLTSDPGLLQGIMALDTTSTLGMDESFMPFMNAGPGAADSLRSFSGSGLSPIMANKQMSPKGAYMAHAPHHMRANGSVGGGAGADIAGIGGRGRTGLTPPRGSYSNPSPYHLRSTTSPQGYAKMQDFGITPGLMFNMRQPEASSKRQLIADHHHHHHPAMPTRTSPRKRIAMDLKSAMGDKIGPQKKRKDKKSESHKDRRTTSAPKRGEYRCGKCGFFPKKEKHSCEAEKLRRERGGGGAGGGGGGAMANGSVGCVPMGLAPNTMSQQQMPGEMGNNAAAGTAAPVDPMMTYLNVPQPTW